MLVLPHIFTFMHYFYQIQVCTTLATLQSFDLQTYLRNQYPLECNPHAHQSIPKFSSLNSNNFYRATLNMDLYNT